MSINFTYKVVKIIDKGIDMSGHSTSGMSPTVIIDDDQDVESRLAELTLSRENLIKVAQEAANEGKNATRLHAKNAAGTLAYQHGTYALRREFMGGNWEMSRPENVEVILNAKLGIQVAFSNVDVTCSATFAPNPRSAKGAGAERVCQGNLFSILPAYGRPPKETLRTYYLMVDEEGGAELSLPILQSGSFATFSERIFLHNASPDLDPFAKLHSDDTADDFVPKVVRR